MISGPDHSCVNYGISDFYPACLTTIRGRDCWIDRLYWNPGGRLSRCCILRPLLALMLLNSQYLKISALNHDVIVGRLASSYTDYPGGASPSTASWFPPQVVCTTAMWDSNCIGFSGMMNDPTLTYQPSLTDYHGYVLDSSSAYKAGGSRQASDGQQVGANIGDIDTALTLNQYSCSTACGTGPYPNN